VNGGADSIRRDVPHPPAPGDAHLDGEAGRWRPHVLVGIIGGGVALWLVIIGIASLGIKQNNPEVAITALSAIGATLAGGFAGWIARGQHVMGRDVSTQDEHGDASMQGEHGDVSGGKANG